MLRAFADHPFGRWIIFGLTVVAFILAFKFAISYLPDSGFFGAFKTVGMAA